jgi:diguanylate cyclase (GGDEF)-like protein/PAS domain S-box-containing protein
LLPRVAPFVLAVVVGVAVVPLPPGEVDWMIFMVAVGAMAVILMSIVVVPWDRLPRGLQVVLPSAYLVVVALLREADGGVQSGIGVFVLLPVIWVSLYGMRRDLVVVLVGAAAALIVPILIEGGDRYETSDLIRAATVVVIGVVIGVTTQRLVNRAQRSATQLRRTVDGALDAFIAVDRSGVIVDWTAQTESLLGWTAQQAIGQTVVERLFPPDRQAELTARLIELRDQGIEDLPRSRFELPAVRADGSNFIAEYSVTAVESADGFQYNVFARDVSELRQATEALQASERRFRGLFDAAPIGMALTSLDGRYLLVNEALCAITGYSREQLLQMSFQSISHPDDLDNDHDNARRLRSGEIASYGLDKRYLHPAGHSVWANVNVTLVRDSDSNPEYLLSQVQDITQRRQFEGQLQHLADHDPLTGLLNRRGFDAELQRHLRHVQRYGKAGALLALDLDGFKYINDVLGHNAGDELIIAVAQLLRGRVRTTDFVSRLGGDEFAMLLPMATADQAALVAEAILEAVRSASLLDTPTVRPVTVSIGVADFSSDDVTGDEVLLRADLAMYDAKELGRNRVVRYSTDEHREPRIKARIGWLDQMASALKSDGFVLDVMPIVNMATDCVDQYELLLRMRGENGDIIPPASFLYIAERFDMIHEIDRWVTTQAIELLAKCDDQLAFAVNLSGKSLADPELLPLIETELRRTGVAPSRLTFELTETSAVADILAARRFGERLHEVGCKFALDDFGAGFGSFYYLKHIPFDYLKIDGEFVKQCATNRTDQLIIASLVSLARGMNKETIAEFTGNDETMAFLRSVGVDHAQGFHIGRPRPVETLLTGEPLPAS